MTPATIHRLERRECEARGQTREEIVAAAVERHNRLMAADALWRDGEPVEPLTQRGAG